MTRIYSEPLELEGYTLITFAWAEGYKPEPNEELPLDHYVPIESASRVATNWMFHDPRIVAFAE